MLIFVNFFVLDAVIDWVRSTSWIWSALFDYDEKEPLFRIECSL